MKTVSIFGLFFLVIGSVVNLQAGILKSGKYMSARSAEQYLYEDQSGELPKFEPKDVDIEVVKNGNSFAIKNVDMPYLTYSFTTDGETESLVRDSIIDAVKLHNKDSKFAQNINGASITDAYEKDDELGYTLNVDWGINSVFGKGTIVLSSDFKIRESTECKSVAWVYKGNHGTKIEKRVPCLVLRSFMNARITKIATPFGPEVDRIIGFAADTVVQLVTSFSVDKTYLFKHR